MFFVPQILINFEISFSLYQFSHSSLEIRGFSPSYQILLSLFDILNAFYNYIWLTLKRKCDGVNNSNIIMKCA